MKPIIRNWLATTGLSLLLLAAVATVYRGRVICIETVFQAGLANLLIHLGLLLLKWFESSYFLVEITAEMSYVLAVLVIFGHLFGWYSSTPLWVLICMGITVYLIGGLIDVFRIKNDVDVINRQLELRRKSEGKVRQGTDRS